MQSMMQQEQAAHMYTYVHAHMSTSILEYRISIMRYETKEAGVLLGNGKKRPNRGKAAGSHKKQRPSEAV